ncbi:MAG TPA: response regulator [Candidatus Acidoferrum sp.]|nr:response regulator [Candidatus Acidoferrum sp.]
MTKSLHVWLVDDQADEQFLVRRVISRLPVSVELRIIDGAKRAMRTLEAATGSEQLPHLIICDVKMPEMDGFDFLMWLRQSRWKHLPVVMCSNSESTLDVTRAYALGANAYHVKAATLDGMRNCFESLTNYWSQSVELPTVRVCNPDN